MKYFATLLISAFISSAIAQSGCPNGIRTRPNYLSLSQTDKDKFHNAIKTLNSQQGSNLYANFTRTHYNVGSGAHGSPGFFVWHRKFIREFEMALQNIDSSIMLPYWDWTRDSQAPERSEIFANNNMGPNGGGGDGGCIDQGTFSGWRVSGPNPNCVARYFSNGETIPSWTAPEILENYFNQQQSYDQFRQRIEGTGHALVHVGIGGNNGDMSYMYSTNDPIFWLHHGFIDLIWSEWQQRHPDRANDYPTNPDTTRLATYNIPVSSTFNTQSPDYCYTYPRWSVNAPRVDTNTPPTTTRQSRRAVDLASLIPQISSFPGYVGPNDRSATSKIRVPAEVPSSFLQMNGIDQATAQTHYLESAIIACKLNLLPSFKPLISL